jgi:hypothetical protein
MGPQLALLRHSGAHGECPVLRQERTQLGQTAMSHFDPLRKSGWQSCCDAQRLIQLCARLET